MKPHTGSWETTLGVQGWAGPLPRVTWTLPDRQSQPGPVGFHLLCLVTK